MSGQFNTPNPSISLAFNMSCCRRVVISFFLSVGNNSVPASSNNSRSLVIRLSNSPIIFKESLSFSFCVAEFAEYWLWLNFTSNVGFSAETSFAFCSRYFPYPASAASANCSGLIQNDFNCAADGIFPSSTYPLNNGVIAGVATGSFITSFFTTFCRSCSIFLTSDAEYPSFLRSVGLTVPSTSCFATSVYLLHCVVLFSLVLVKFPALISSRNPCAASPACPAATSSDVNSFL